MTSKEKNDPILERSTLVAKDDIIMFKNETLKDFKEVQTKLNKKYKVLELEIREKLESYEKRITTYENKITELSKLINTDKTIREKVDSLIEFKEKANDTMLTEKIRLDNFSKDLNSNVNRIDDILKDSVLYPGIIGGISKYKTFHDLIDYVLTQCSQNLTFREKSILDFKGYKAKLDNTISSFNSQIKTLLDTTSEYTKNSIKELEERIKSIFNVYDDRLQDSRLENANYAVGLERATEALKKELERLEVIKKELYKKVDNSCNDVKNDNTRVTKLFTGYKKKFNIIEHKFTQLSDFIKDIRFRINIKEEIKRREYTQMSDLINFDKKKKGFYDGINDHNILKRGLTSQLKDYIAGRITADQIFKKRSDQKDEMSQSLNIRRRKSSVSGISNSDGKYNEEFQLNFKDSMKNSLQKRMSMATQNLIVPLYRKEIIKEESDDNNSQESNSSFNNKIEKSYIKKYRKKVKEIEEEKDEDEKEKEKEKQKEREKEKEKKMEEEKKEKEKKMEEEKKEKEKKLEEEKKEKEKEKKIEEEKKEKENEKLIIKNYCEKDKNKEKENEKVKEEKAKEYKNIADKKDKDIALKSIKEEHKIQIISKDKEKDKTKENEKKSEIKTDFNLTEKKPRASIKNVINNLFNVKNIINNIDINDPYSISEKKDYLAQKANRTQKFTNNINSGIYNSLYNDIRNDANKMKYKNKSFNRPATVVNIKKNNNPNQQNNTKQNNIGIITNLENTNNSLTNRLNNKEAKTTVNPVLNPVTVKIYNTTMNQTSNFNQKNKKKNNSSSQKNNRFFLKQNTGSSKGLFATKKEENRKNENLLNNLNFLLSSDINVDDYSFLNSKRKK